MEHARWLHLPEILFLPHLPCSEITIGLLVAFDSIFTKNVSYTIQSTWLFIFISTRILGHSYPFGPRSSGSTGKEDPDSTGALRWCWCHDRFTLLNMMIPDIILFDITIYIYYIIGYHGLLLAKATYPAKDDFFPNEFKSYETLMWVYI